MSSMKHLVLYCLIVLLGHISVYGQCCSSSCSIDFGSLNPVNPNATINRCNDVSANGFAMTAGSEYTFCYSFTTGAANFDDYMTVSAQFDLGNQTCEDNSGVTIEICQGATPVAVIGTDAGATTFQTTAPSNYSLCVTLDPSDTDCSGNVQEICIAATPSSTPPVPCQPVVANPALNGSAPSCGSLVTIGTDPIIACDGFNYEWTSTNPAFTTVAGTISSTDNGQINVTESGTYTLVITDLSGSEVDLDANPNEVTVTIAQPTVATISGYTTICNGEKTTLTASGGDTFTWTALSGTIDGTNNTNEIEVSTSGTYQVEVSNAGSCPTTATVNVTVLPDACCNTNIYQQCVSHLDATIGLDRNEVFVSSAALQDVSQGYLHNFMPPPPPTVGTATLTNLFVSTDITNFFDDVSAQPNCNFEGTYINISQGCSAPFAGTTVNNAALCAIIERLNIDGQCSIPTNNWGPATSSTGTFTDDLIACNSFYSPPVDENTSISVDIIPSVFGDAACAYNNNAIDEGVIGLEYTICLEYVYDLVTDINITPDNPASFCTGATVDLNENATSADGSPAWTSSNNSIATVNGFGIVTGISAGTVTITYTDENGCTATEDVTIDDCCGGAVQFIKN